MASEGKKGTEEWFLAVDIHGHVVIITRVGLLRTEVEHGGGSPYTHVEFKFLVGYPGENIQKGELTCLELSR